MDRRVNLALLLTALTFTSCASQSLYANWGKQLATLEPRNNTRTSDVSLLLGSPPSHCDAVEGSKAVIGVIINKKQPVIDAVRPGSPAEKAGLQTGDTVLKVAGQSVTMAEQVHNFLATQSRDGIPLEIETNRGHASPIPAIPKTEQCYWEIRAGKVAQAGGGGFVNQWGGAASVGSSAYQRFFRTTCRVFDGFVAGCKSNWQE